ncbi:MAG: hypothetical protein AAFV43_12190 [Planctomycetota bacterium]
MPRATLPWYAPPTRLAAAFLLLCLSGTTATRAVEPPVRLRLAFAAADPVRWDGVVSVDDGEIHSVLPLSIDRRLTGAIHEERGQLRVSYGVSARRGVVDFDVSAPARTQLSVALTAGGEPFVFDLDEVRQKRSTATVDGVTVLLERAPNDRLRIEWPTDSVVFAPASRVDFDVWVDAPREPTDDDPLELVTKVLRGRDGPVVSTDKPQRFDSSGRVPTPVSLSAPSEEGVYELVLSVREPPGFSRRFFPQGEAEPLLERRVQILVVDPAVVPDRLPATLDGWRVVNEPLRSNATTRDRLSAWTRWPGSEARPEPRADAAPVLGGRWRLEPAAAPHQAGWHELPLTLPTAAEPMLIEVATPAASPQLLGLTVLDSEGGELKPIGEPLLIAPTLWPAERDTRVTRWFVWPRTTSPVLVVANPSATHAAEFGDVRVYQPKERLARADPGVASARNVALDVRSTDVIARFAASRATDAETGVRYADLQTLWQVVRRIADEVEAQGANTAIVAANTDGAVWYDTQVLGASPRHDLGAWVQGTNDLPRRPLLSLLLREFQRRGLSLVPSLDLSGPLPRLERMARRSPEHLLASPGVEWSAGKARYNPLAEPVGAECVAVVEELAGRYGRQRALAGIGVEMAATSPLLLADEPLAGFDTRTVDRFLADQSAELPRGPRTRKRHAELIEQHAADAWQAWCADRIVEANRRLDQASGRNANGAPRPVVRLTTSLLAAPALRSGYADPIDSPPNATDWARRTGLTALASADPLVNVSAPMTVRDGALPRFLAAANGRSRLKSILAPTGVGNLIATSRYRYQLAGAAVHYGAPVEVHAHVANPNVTRQALAQAAVGVRPALLIDHAALGLWTEDAVAARQAFAALPNETPTSVAADSGLALATVAQSDTAVITVANQTPWPMRASVSIAVETRSTVAALAPPQADRRAEWCQPGGHVLLAELPPFGVRAWRFSDPAARVTGVRTDPSEAAVRQLEDSLSRLSNRDRAVRRSYDRIPNPSFEPRVEDAAVEGWTLPDNRTAAVVTGSAVDGDAVLRLAAATSRSADSERATAAGPTVHSDWFPAPATGQFALVLQARGEGLPDDAALRIDFELESGETTTRSIRAGDLFDAWREVVFAVDDLPLDEQPMRLRFTLDATDGSVSIDDLQAEDLMLPLDYYAEETRGQRFALVRLAHDAETAFSEGRYDECRQLIEGYWPQFVMQNFPEAPPAAEPLDPPVLSDNAGEPGDPAEDAPEEETPTVAERVRQYLPRWWR